MADVQVYKKSPAELDLAQRRARKSMRGQVTMFSLMIFLTLVSFTMVTAFEHETLGFSKYFIIANTFVVCSRSSRFTIILFHAYERKRAWRCIIIHVCRDIACVYHASWILINCMVVKLSKPVEVFGLLQVFPSFSNLS